MAEIQFPSKETQNEILTKVSNIEEQIAPATTQVVETITMNRGMMDATTIYSISGSGNIYELTYSGVGSSSSSTVRISLFVDGVIVHQAYSGTSNSTKNGMYLVSESERMTEIPMISLINDNSYIISPIKFKSNVQILCKVTLPVSSGSNSTGKVTIKYSV